ncbi:MAG: tetratricopeptide repeat protein, partial [Pyrinomonadaceae bacterium]
IAKLTEKQDGVPADTQAPTLALIKTSPGMILGTVAYMSPEQARGLEVDARTDVFSLGIMLYEMLAGRLPFTGETTADMLGALLHKEPPPLRELAPDTPVELQHIVSKALRKDPDERYQTANSLRVDLKTLKQEFEFAAKLGRAATPERNHAVSQQDATATTANAAIEGAGTQAATVRPTSTAEHITSGIKQHKGSVTAALMMLLAVLGFGYWYSSHHSPALTQIESIAVLPFQNEGGNVDAEYLSDGMTESLIGSLSQLPKLSVKARSSVFRYKGKDADAKTVGRELNVQAVLNGRVVQRGNDLTLYIELVDATTENSLWKETYNRPLANLVALQNEVARDVATKLRVRLSGADERKVAKNYTANAEALQLYLKGRYHVFKLTPPELQKGISYFQQAIDIDPSYALAYAGLSDAYRALALGGEMNPTEVLPKAKAAAQKALELDDTLSEVHTTLGMNIFWYDWDWNAAESQFKRALELNPNNADAHLFYAHLLSNTGRHAEALAEIKRAREIDPLSPFASALEGQFLLHAGRADEALASLQETFELAPNYWFPHLFAASVYTEKGMYVEAVAEARRAKELSPMQTVSDSYSGYALAKSGKRDEARAVLEELLKLSKERFIPPYHVAIIYNGLGERDEALNWLERGYQQRDPKMAFLKIDPKWNNLRSDPHFQDLLRRVGFTP